MSMPPYYTSPSGYTCSQCGTFVPDGCVHSCPTFTTPTTLSPVPSLDRIAVALERIARALELAEDQQVEEEQ